MHGLAPWHVQRILEKLSDVKKDSNGWVAKCPAHEDDKPSLNIAIGDNGSVVMDCKAGCTIDAVLDALKLKKSDLYPSAERHRIDKTYDYHNEAGELVYQVCRLIPKDFRQRKPDGQGGWEWNTSGVEKVLYRLPQLIAADPEQNVFIVEGEKDVDKLTAFGLVATTNVGGAGKWKAAYSRHLEGRKVVIIPDNDKSGRDHARDVRQHLQGVAKDIRILELSSIPEKGDVSDWINMGGTKEKLLLLVECCLAPPPLSQPKRVQPEEDDNWPEPMDERAYHGLAGTIVHRIIDETEADPVAILSQILGVFGICAGRNSFVLIEEDRHYPNLFMVLVGRTSKGRKGTSTGRVKRVFTGVDEEFVFKRMASGLSSGEGLIWQVRDPIWKREPIKEKGRTISHEEVEIDPGIADKRLMIVESEFVLPLRMVRREGNTLSARIREAWDDGRLSTLTKNFPARASNAHIGIVGHITRDELIRNTEEVEMANGFANRFIWLCVKRSKKLPMGGRPVYLEDLVFEMQKAIDFSKGCGQVHFSEDGAEVWKDAYSELSEEKPGMVGMITNRAESQVLRLSLAYALLDKSNVIEPEHVGAALAFWNYAEESVRYVFETPLNNQYAMAILSEIDSRGQMTRTEIRDLFSHKTSADDISAGLCLLERKGLVYCVIEKVNKGRPKEIWISKRGT